MDSLIKQKCQNEFIKILADGAKNTIWEDSNKCKSLGIFADTIPDVSHAEQLVVGMRYVNSKGVAEERTIAVVKAKSIKCKNLAAKIVKYIYALRLDVNYIVFLSCDFASTMSGWFEGVQTSMSSMLGWKILYFQCLGH
ncbi:hypothetical protein KIL84_021624 [Mauremys mutica]|uniref:DUF4371 domain-containing protein n=1 Tax=Mauremys mutica TaxID=74926 RepID=A0A9D3X9K5_9SAUR|nr:hypothetical protein KIL84_021624 [Mauremys mutica]